MELKFGTVQDTVQQTNKRTDALRAELSKIQESYNEVMVENEKNKRDLVAKEAVVEQIHEQHNLATARLRKAIIEADLKMAQEMERGSMESED